MKKIFAFAAVAAAMLFAGNTVNAQLGIHVGYAPQTMYGTTTTTVAGTTLTSHDSISMNGFYGGVDYNVNLTGDLNVCVGLQYRMNSKTKENSATVLGVTTTTTTKYNQSVIDVPILFNYGLSLSDDFKISVFVGPTISYALSGSSRVTNVTAGTTVLDATSNWYKEDEGNMNAFDLSGTIGVNLTFSGIRVFGGYNMGLLNLSKADNTTMKSSNFFVGVGYAL